MQRDPVCFVYFDMGGTVLRVHPSVAEVYARAAVEHGFEVDAAGVEKRFRTAWKGALARSLERGHTCSEEILRAEWLSIVRESFGDSVPSQRIHVLFEDLYERFSSAAAWRLADGARETFDLLRRRGIRLGVLSNWDRRLRRTLEEMGLGGIFDVLVISHEVGFEKPHRRIFEEAVARAAEAPERILHVGDSWEFDIAPARDLGLRTLWMSPAVERAGRSDAHPAAETLLDLSQSDWEELLGTSRAAIGDDADRATKERRGK